MRIHVQNNYRSTYKLQSIGILTLSTQDCSKLLGSVGAFYRFIVYFTLYLFLNETYTKVGDHTNLLIIANLNNETYMQTKAL